ncbi:hypothetical protein ACMFMF_005215 [Clarireedia jacksonii]
MHIEASLFLWFFLQSVPATFMMIQASGVSCAQQLSDADCVSSRNNAFNLPRSCRQSWQDSSLIEVLPKHRCSNICLWILPSDNRSNGPTGFIRESEEQCSGHNFLRLASILDDDCVQTPHNTPALSSALPEQSLHAFHDLSIDIKYKDFQLYDQSHDGNESEDDNYHDGSTPSLNSLYSFDSLETQGSQDIDSRPSSCCSAPQNTAISASTTVDDDASMDDDISMSSSMDSREDFIDVPSRMKYCGIGEWAVDNGDFDALELSLDDLRDCDVRPSPHNLYIQKALKTFEAGFYGVHYESRGTCWQYSLCTIFEEGC